MAGAGIGTLISGADYATVAELKGRLGITDAVDDVALAAVLSSVSRQVEGYCGRVFTLSASATRTFTARSLQTCAVDDLVSVTTLTTDEDALRTYATTWASGTYELWPYNAATAPEPQPYLELRVTRPEDGYYFPTYARCVQVTGVWGWPAVPVAVNEAVLLQAARIFKRKDAPFGVTGAPELGVLRELAPFDVDAKALLRPYIRGGPF